MINEILDKKRMVLQFDAGVIDGKQRHSNVAYNLIPTATDEQIHNVATAIATCVEMNLLKVFKEDTNMLVSD